ncbi:hypothetical protein C7460_104198 [Marinoscillum furvescens DSM 4134]|uniref:Uncharacterized protein n=1 Tax=Marinoscillum furvescens DSM 4134 TaxID=1122208 RepID=A0A3D9L750_MARFU|nr:hypothetical protein C7460_104198 [Marinoscillum furvescens DSM 4134]
MHLLVNLSLPEVSCRIGKLVTFKMHQIIGQSFALIGGIIFVEKTPHGKYRSVRSSSQKQINTRCNKGIPDEAGDQTYRTA